MEGISANTREKIKKDSEVLLQVAKNYVLGEDKSPEDRELGVNILQVLIDEGNDVAMFYMALAILAKRIMVKGVNGREHAMELL